MTAARPDLISLQHTLTERERRAAATVHHLREQIAILTTHLTHAEAELADLATTRRTLTTLTTAPAPAPAMAAEPPSDDEPADPDATSDLDDADPDSTGTTTGTTTGITTTASSGSPAYTQILAVSDPSASLRAKDICLVLGLEPIPKNTEGLRAKLKRLAARGALHEPSPGLFALATPPEPP